MEAESTPAYGQNPSGRTGYRGETRSSAHTTDRRPLRHGRECFTARAALEIAQRRLCNNGMIAPVDGFERLGQRLAVFPVDQLGGAADQVDDVGLGDGFWKHGRDCLGKALGPSTTAVRISLRPRTLNPCITLSQSLAPLICSVHSPRPPLWPEQRTPMAR